MCVDASINPPLLTPPSLWGRTGSGSPQDPRADIKRRIISEPPPFVSAAVALCLSRLPLSSTPGLFLQRPDKILRVLLKSSSFLTVYPS